MSGIEFILFVFLLPSPKRKKTFTDYKKAMLHAKEAAWIFFSSYIYMLEMLFTECPSSLPMPLRQELPFPTDEMPYFLSYYIIFIISSGAFFTPLFQELFFPWFTHWIDLLPFLFTFVSLQMLYTCLLFLFIEIACHHSQPVFLHRRDIGICDMA